MYDPLAIAALVISIASLLFVAVKEGVGLIFEYRESDTVTRRKKEIDDSLRKELRKELKRFQERESSEGENSEEKVFESIEQLGSYAFMARSLSGGILDGMTRYLKAGFKNLLGALALLFLTLLLWSANTTEIATNIPLALTLLAYVVATIGTSYYSAKNLAKYYYLREKFNLLSENARLDYCTELSAEIREKKL